MKLILHYQIIYNMICPDIYIILKGKRTVVKSKFFEAYGYPSTFALIKNIFFCIFLYKKKNKFSETSLNGYLQKSNQINILILQRTIEIIGLSYSKYERPFNNEQF